MTAASASSIAALTELLGEPVEHARCMSGGDLSAVYEVMTHGGSRFVAKQAPNVVAEAEMLHSMASTGVRTPKVMACEKGWLVLSLVDSFGDLSGDTWDDLARQLTLLHRPVETQFGWHCDHSFGAVVIPNGRADNWAEFWAENRLATNVPHVDAAIGARLKQLCAQIDKILPAHPDATLLHGDLWGGNVLVGRDGTVAGLIDPASYYGHREVDWAMLTVFDVPPDCFFAGMVPDADWRRRLGCYRLWPLLVHLRLFGQSYRSAVERELTALGF